MLEITPTSIIGAGIGDSGAWLISHERVTNLTRAQQRKPLLGSGSACPISFSLDRSLKPDETFLVATDGLLRYFPEKQIRSAATNPTVEYAARTLIQTARLPSGKLQDDIGFALCGSNGCV